MTNSQLLIDLSNLNIKIFEHLNYRNIKTPKGLNYHPKLVWVSLFKYRRRQKRSFKDEMERVVETLVAVPFRYFNK